MADSRTKNASRNIVSGFVNRFVVLVLPFITRTLTLYLLGASYLGIGTLFTSVLSFLSLAELGLGSAIVYSMYKPIAQNDYESVCAFLRFYRSLYRLIGFAILVVGTFIVPAIPYLISGEVPPAINVYILYYIYLINSVISYFFAGYRQSLLSAHQRSDITHKVSSLVQIAVQFGQILALFLTKNYYIYALVPICGTLITNLCNAIITRRMYPQVICKGELPPEAKKEIKSKISGLFGTKLNSVVVHSSDVVIISAFLGLALTAQFGNYYYIMNAVCGFVSIVFSSMTAGIGNKIVKESLKDNYRFFQNLSFFNAWIVNWCSVCFICLYEPFMEVWVGQEQQLGMAFVVLMVVYFYIYEIQRTILTYKDAAGLWNKDKARPFVSMVINLISNMILVQFIGIYGIVVSTIIAFLVSLPWANHVLFKELFHITPWKNLLTICKHLLVTTGVAGITYGVCDLFPGGIGGLLLRIGVCCLLPNILMVIVYRKNAGFQSMCMRIHRLVDRQVL